MPERYNIVYILHKFPYFTETFITNEILEIKSRGHNVKICSLFKPIVQIKQHKNKELLKDVFYSKSPGHWVFWWSQIYFIVVKPITYVLLFKEIISQPYKIKPILLLTKRLLLFFQAISTAYTLKDKPIDLLHVHFASLPGAATKIVSELLGIPFVITTHAYDIYRIEDSLMEFIVQTTSHLVTISEYNKSMLLKDYPEILKEDRISVIHCGIKLDDYDAYNTQKHEDVISILSVGSLVEKKGHRYLIEACNILKSRGVKFSCTIIGGGPKDHKANLERIIEISNLDKLVNLKGACTTIEVLEALRNHDIFVLASVIASDGDRDGIPVAIMEALAMRMPVISTNISGIPEIVKHGKTGILVPEKDSVALADNISDLANNKSNYQMYGKRGRFLVEKQFNITHSVNELLALYKKILEEDSNE